MAMGLRTEILGTGTARIGTSAVIAMMARRETTTGMTETRRDSLHLAITDRTPRATRAPTRAERCAPI
jgi:hypothetical protein